MLRGKFLVLTVAPCLCKRLTLGEVGQRAYRKPLCYFCIVFIHLKSFQNKTVVVWFLFLKKKREKGQYGWNVENKEKKLVRPAAVDNTRGAKDVRDWGLISTSKRRLWARVCVPL